jgi:hypothetical protein
MAPRTPDEPDAYERAAQRIDADRRSRELGDPIPVLPPGLATPLPDRRKMRRTLYLIGVLLVVLVVGRLAASSHAPELARSCTTLQIAVSPTEVRPGAGVKWSVTGPSGRPITVTVGGKRVSRPGIALADCRAAAAFLVPTLAPGEYKITVSDGSGSSSARMTVTG